MEQVEKWERKFEKKFRQKVVFDELIWTSSPKNRKFGDQDYGFLYKAKLDSFMVLLESYEDDTENLGKKIKEANQNGQVGGNVVLFRKMQIDINKIEINLDRLDLAGWGEEPMTRRRQLLQKLTILANSFQYNSQQNSPIDAAGSPAAGGKGGNDLNLGVSIKSLQLEAAIAADENEKMTLQQQQSKESEMDGGLTLTTILEPNTIIHISLQSEESFETVRLAEMKASLLSLKLQTVVALVTFINSTYLHGTSPIYPSEGALHFHSIRGNGGQTGRCLQVVILELSCIKKSTSNGPSAQILEYIYSQLFTASALRILTPDMERTKIFLDDPKSDDYLMEMLKEKSTNLFHLPSTLNQNQQQTVPYQPVKYPDMPPPSLCTDRLICCESIKKMISFPVLNDPELAHHTSDFVINLYKNFMDDKLTQNIYKKSHLTQIHEKLLSILQSVCDDMPPVSGFTKYLPMWQQTLGQLRGKLQSQFEVAVLVKNRRQIEQSEQIRGRAKLAYLQFLENFENSHGGHPLLSSSNEDGKSLKQVDAEERQKILKNVGKRLPDTFPPNWIHTLELDFDKEATNHWGIRIESGGEGDGDGERQIDLKKGAGLLETDVSRSSQSVSTGFENNINVSKDDKMFTQSHSNVGSHANLSTSMAATMAAASPSFEEKVEELKSNLSFVENLLQTYQLCVSLQDHQLLTWQRNSIGQWDGYAIDIDQQLLLIKDLRARIEKYLHGLLGS